MCILPQFKIEKKKCLREVQEVMRTCHKVPQNQQLGSSHVPHGSFCKEDVSFLGGAGQKLGAGARSLGLNPVPHIECSWAGSSGLVPHLKTWLS